MSFQFTALKTACPICNGQSRGRNRGGRECKAVGELVFCITGLDLPVPPGWVFTKLDKNGLFGIFAPDNGKISEADKERIKRERDLLRAKRLEEEAKRLSLSLSVSQRDKEIRKIISQLSLSEKHRQDLHRRGLNDSQIKAGLFRSVQAWQKLEFEVDHRLAGVSIDGRSLITQSGYICPTWNADGLITGWQLRADDTENGKYKWPSSNIKKRPNGPTSHLKETGELPITICRPDGDIQRIGLCEGILKPWVAGQLSGWLFVGAAGGNFKSSKIQLQATLQQLGQGTITYFPDAGAANNRHVLNRDCNTLTLLQSWGYEVEVADWGQWFDKEAGDIDEILTSNPSITYKPTAEYLRLASPSYNPIDDSEFDWSEPDPELVAQHNQWLENEEIIASETAKERQRQWQESYPERAHGEWHQLSHLTKKPNKQFSERYLTLDLAEDIKPGFIFVKSAMGTGKTELLKHITSMFECGNIMSYRNSLLMNLCERLQGKVDFVWNLDTGDNKLNQTWRQSRDWLALCIDSIFKTIPKKVLILEEVSKLLDHALRGATCKRLRAKILNRFADFIREAEYIICLDADLANPDINYLQSLDPSKQSYIYHNTFKPWSWDITFFDGLVNPVEYKPNSKGPFLSNLIDSIVDGKKCLVVGDTQVSLQAIEAKIKRLFPDIITTRCDSFTKADNPEEIGDFLTNPNEYIKQVQPSVVFLSPTAESSLDITVEHFDEVWGLFCGVVSSQSAMQLLGRYRIPVPRFIFAREYTINASDNHSPFPKVVKKQLHKKNFEIIQQIALQNYLEATNKPEEEADLFDMIAALSQIIDLESRTWKDPHLEAVVNYQARDNYQKTNFRACLKELLKEAGHSIISLTTPDDRSISMEREQILIDRAKKISEAKDITKEAAEALMLKMESTSEERWQIEKALLRDKLPGVELTPEFIYWCKYDEPQILSQLKLYWHWKNKGSAQNADRKKWAGALKYHTPLWDIHCSSLKLAVIDELNIEQFLDDGEYTNNDPKALSFFEACLTQHKHRLKLALGINVTPEYGPVRLIKHILDRVAINFSGKQRRLASGERQRFYKAVLPEATGFSLDVLKAYELRFCNLINQPENTGIPTNGDTLNDEVSQTSFLGNYSIVESVTSSIEPVSEPENTGTSNNTGISNNTNIPETGLSQTSFIVSYPIEESATNTIQPAPEPENTGTPTNTDTPETDLSQTSLVGGYSIERSVTNSIEPTFIPENTGTPPTNEPEGIGISSVDPVLYETIEGFTYLVREVLAGVYELDDLWQGICDLFDGVVEDVWNGVWQLLNL
ncbi:hypothetical protein NG798_26605, partial [Ancylothrix sp. C2]|uniref:plasmid replication protein, CyRepA1 family n=1 Tax=Ancylothrix sp. D3o TaxID=2953691 RepID=UPI0029500842